MKNKNCPVCHNKIYSGLGRGCRLCGMPLEDESKEFCSKECKKRYNQIHEDGNQLVSEGSFR